MNDQINSQALDRMLQFAARGYDVLPAKPSKPLTPYKGFDDWPTRATHDPDQIRRWWTEGWTDGRTGEHHHPDLSDALVAVSLKGTGLTVIDFDPEDGYDVEDLMHAAGGENGHWWDRYAEVWGLSTARPEGQHHWFRGSTTTRKNSQPLWQGPEGMIEVHSDDANNYVVVKNYDLPAPDAITQELPAHFRVVPSAQAGADRSAAGDADSGDLAEPDIAPLDHSDALPLFERYPALHHIRAFAEMRGVSPWALAVCVLARVLAHTSPAYTVSSYRGPASLNLFAVLAGPSGSGKSAAIRVSEEFLDVLPPADGSLPMEVSERGLGTGEGLADAFGWLDKKTATYNLTTPSVLFKEDEVAVVEALLSRAGVTLPGFLNTAFMGDGLSLTNSVKSHEVPAHRYRMVMITGAQPSRADVLLNDGGSGFANRQLWVDVYRPPLPEGYTPPRVGPWPWHPQPHLQVLRTDANGVIVFDPGRRVDLPIPPAADAEVRQLHEALNVPLGGTLPDGIDPLDTHRALVRMKLTAALALLHERTQLTDEDWEIAGALVEMSSKTREMVQRLRAQARAQDGTVKAAERGRQQAIAKTTAEASGDELRTECQRAVLRFLDRKGAADKKTGEVAEFTNKAILDSIGRYYRPVLDEALDALLRAGLVESEWRQAARRPAGQQARYTRKA